MAETLSDSKESLEIEKGSITLYQSKGSSLDYNSGNAAEDAFCRHGIDEKHEKRILRKLDIRLLPFASLLYLLSYL
jgi:hypothetical protein